MNCSRHKYSIFLLVLMLTITATVLAPEIAHATAGEDVPTDWRDAHQLGLTGSDSGSDRGVLIRGVWLDDERWFIFSLPGNSTLSFRAEYKSDIPEYLTDYYDALAIFQASPDDYALQNEVVSSDGPGCPGFLNITYKACDRLEGIALSGGTYYLRVKVPESNQAYLTWDYDGASSSTPLRWTTPIRNVPAARDVDGYMPSNQTEHWYALALGEEAAGLQIKLLNKQSNLDLYIYDASDLNNPLYGSTHQSNTETGAALPYSGLAYLRVARAPTNFGGNNTATEYALQVNWCYAASISTDPPDAGTAWLSPRSGNCGNYGTLYVVNSRVELHSSGSNPLYVFDSWLKNGEEFGSDLYYRTDTIVGNTMYTAHYFLGAPKIIAPSATGALPTPEVTFEWESIPSASGYELLIDDDQGVQDNPLHRIPVPPSAESSVSITVPDFASGTYFWQVRAQHTDGNWGQFSTPRQVAVKLCYPLTLTSSPGGKEVTAQPKSSANCQAGYYNEGTIIYLSARPDSGYEIKEWVGTTNNSSSNWSNQLSMQAGPTTAGVTYGPICYSLTLARNGSGDPPLAAPAYSPSCPIGKYVVGEPIQLTAIPAAGYEVQYWRGTNNDQSSSTTNNLTMPAANKTVTVYYIKSSATPPPTAPTPPPPAPPDTTCVLPTITLWKAEKAPADAEHKWQLVYTTSGATRLDLFGHDLPIPSGVWPVYGKDDNTWWVLRAYGQGDPEHCWVEEAIYIERVANLPPAGTYSGGGIGGFTDVDVSQRNITLTFYDWGTEDGDIIKLTINGQVIVASLKLLKAQQVIPVTLNPGANTIVVTALNEGGSPPNTTAINISHVISGMPDQVSRGLHTGQSESFIIRAP
jgi:hypothetical protein